MGRPFGERGKPPTCHPDRPYYARNMCKACHMRAFREANSERAEKYNARVKRWRQDHPERIAEYQRRRREKRRYDPVYAKQARRVHRRSQLKCRFGLTEEQFYGLFARQGNACPLCGVHISPDRPKSYALDHDHRTGIFRGLVCQRCNSGIGMFGESVEIVRRVAKYLSTAKSQQLAEIKNGQPNHN